VKKFSALDAEGVVQVEALAGRLVDDKRAGVIMSNGIKRALGKTASSFTVKKRAVSSDGPGGTKPVGEAPANRRVTRACSITPLTPGNPREH
jgi:hypothetical protein